MTRGQPQPQQPRPGDRPSSHGRPDDAVLALIRLPYVAEILAVLDERPQSLAGLRHATGAPRRRTVNALQALAAHRALTRDPDTGSWDTIESDQVCYRLTPAGRRLVEQLFHLDSWWAVYSMYPPFFE